MVLLALQHEPFEPLETVGLKWLSLKSAFLLAIVSANRMGELHALSVHEECCCFLSSDAGLVLRLILNSIIRSYPSPMPVSLLSCTLSTLLRTVEQGCDQLFVCYKTNSLGPPVTKTRLSHWGVDAME